MVVCRLCSGLKANYPVAASMKGKWCHSCLSTTEPVTLRTRQLPDFIVVGTFRRVARILVAVEFLIPLLRFGSIQRRSELQSTSHRHWFLLSRSQDFQPRERKPACTLDDCCGSC